MYKERLYFNIIENMFIFVLLLIEFVSIIQGHTNIIIL